MIRFLKQWRQNYDTQPLFNRQVKDIHLSIVNTCYIILFGLLYSEGMRTGWSFTQKYIQDDITDITDRDIGLMNTFFLLFLGIGLYFSGIVCDKYNPKQFLLVGMILSASCVMAIGLFRVFFISEVYVFVILQGFNGLFESACLPAYMRMLGNWYSSQNRGLILGIWSGCRSFGDTFGLLIGDFTILRLHFSWYWSLVLFGGISLIMGYVICEFTTEKPSAQGLATIVEDEFEECSIMNPSYFRKAQFQSIGSNENHLQAQMTNMDEEDLDKLRERLILKYGGSGVMNVRKVQEEYESVSFFQALRIPGVFWYTLDFMCLKGLNYGILFWFPKFLQQNHLENSSSGISIMWTIGVLIGGIISGILGDKLHQRRGILMPPSLILLIISLAWFDRLDSSSDSLFHFYFVSFLMGLFLGGPYNVQHGSLIIDLGKHSVLKGNKQAIGTITGIIEGAGSLSSSIIQLVIPYFGQDNIFIIFIIIAFIAIVCIIPVAYEDYIYLKSKKTLFIHSSEPSPTVSLSHHEMREFSSNLNID